MANLEDLLREMNKNPFGKKKKPKEDLPDHQIIPNSDLLAEGERLKQKYTDLGIDLGERTEDDDLKIRLPERGREKLENLNYSVDLLSGCLGLNELIIKKKFFEKNSEKENLIEPIKNFSFEKFSKEIKEYNLSSINKYFISAPQYSPLGLNLSVKDSASITADNIGEFALPIVEYIRQTQPDYVVASDRGARLLGLAVFRLYNRLYGELPTVDGTLRFRRFSKSNSQEQTEKYLQPLANEMLAHKKKPKVLVLDDWVCSGGTKRLAQSVFDKLGRGKIKVKFGVLLGSGADISGHGWQTSGFVGVTDWRDDSDIIGVRYGNSDFGYQGIVAEPVRSEQAIDYRQRMYKGIDKLVEKITERK